MFIITKLAKLQNIKNLLIKSTAFFNIKLFFDFPLVKKLSFSVILYYFSYFKY
jgi:hypothetical protein